jgi:hypothetical protein
MRAANPARLALGLAALGLPITAAGYLAATADIARVTGRDTAWEFDRELRILFPYARIDYKDAAAYLAARIKER